MKKLLFLVIVISLLAACKNITGIQGSGTAKTETRNLTGFKEVKAGGAVNIDISFKPEYSITVEADDNLLEHITTEVSGDTLVIGMKDNINSKNKIIIKITMPELADLHISGASTANVAGFKGDKLTAELSGASKAKIDGVTSEFNGRASGASSIDAANLKAENADVNSSGASNITVNASGDLKADASGASSVTYIGDPKSIKQNASGASSVKKK